MNRSASALLSSTNVINPSDTACFSLYIPYTWECPKLFSPLCVWTCRSLFLAYCSLSVAHTKLRKRNLTVCCPAREDIVDRTNDRAQYRWFYRSQYRQHNCIIISESASEDVPIINWSTCGPSGIPLKMTRVTNFDVVYCIVGIWHTPTIVVATCTLLQIHHLLLPLPRKTP